MSQTIYIMKNKGVYAMVKTMVILMGIQGSGKSTFYATQLSNDYVRVNLDTLKTRYQEGLLIDKCFNEEKSFAVDNTNPTKEVRAKYINLAKANGYRVIGYFMQSRIKDCIKRNAIREGKARVPEKAIIATSNKLEMPSFEEGFDELYFVMNDDSNITIKEWKD